MSDGSAPTAAAGRAANDGDLATLLGEREITRMIVAYAAANDAADWDAVAATYIPEGRMSRPTASDDFLEGREAILTAFRARPPRRSRHVVANIRVDVAGDEATAVSQILLFTARDAHPLLGSYHDKLVHTPAGWRFAERRGSLDFP